MAARSHFVRSALLAGVACVAAGAWTAVFEGARAAKARALEHGYAELGFDVGARALWRDALDEHFLRAAPLTFVCAAAALLAALALRRENVLRSAAAVAGLGAVAYLAALHASKSWLGARDFAFAAAASLFVWRFSLRSPRLDRSADSTAPADAGREPSTWIVGAAAAPALLWCARELPWRPGAVEAWLRVAAVLVAAFAARRALRQLEPADAPARAWRRAWSLALLAVLAPAVLWAFARRAVAPALRVERPLNVLVIGIDTLRADATSIRGPGPDGRDTTPNLRQFAARALDFEHAVSQAPWTLPSFASMFTGRYPLEHGAHRITSRLGRRETTLAEVLREAGYGTCAVTSHIYLDRRHGLDQGFESFDASNALGHQAITSRAVTDLAIAALERRDERPFFLFAHYFDPHYEYRDHEPSTWADGYRGWLRDQNDFENLLKIRHLVEAPDIEWLRALYHEEIEHTDAQVGRLLEWLRAAGLESDTLVVVVSDHGEEFGERGNFGHTISLHEEQLAVPLLVAAPGIAAQRVGTVVETRALFDTVLDVLGLDFVPARRAESWLGVAKRERDAGAALADARAFSCVWLDDSKLSWGKRVLGASVREGRWKLVHDLTRGRRALFDLDSDPAERRNVHADPAAPSARLEALLEPWIKEQTARRTGSSSPEVDEATARALRSLGYM
jgi:arylsulfatase A-like enzyme